MSDAKNSIMLPLAFRVGAVGHRDLHEADIERLKAEIRNCLTVVRDEVRRLSAIEAAAALYSATPPKVAPGPLRVVSPLAEGADRLIAEEGLRLGAELNVPLPFSQSEYEKDFPDSMEAFRGLLAKGNAFTLDGLRDGGAVQNESYEAVGQFVARNSDLIVAVWDGKHERGPGGTGQIVRFAVRVGVPVWWIHASEANPPTLVRNAFDLNTLKTAPRGDAAYEGLKKLLAQAIVPPEAEAPERGGIFGWAAEGICNSLKADGTPLGEFLTERRLPKWPIWRAYDAMMARAAPHVAKDSSSLAPPKTTVERYWKTIFDVADESAAGYGDRYRSSYVLIALLAVVALGSAALTGDEMFRAFWFVLGFEAAAVAGIIALVVVNQMYRWQERWISYRLVAELSRKQYVLSSLGRALPGSDVVRLSFDSRDGAATPRESWVAWFFMAALRGAEFPQGDMIDAKARSLAVGRSLVADQKAYHEKRLSRSRLAGDRIRLLSEVFFALTIAFVIGKFLALHFHWELGMRGFVLVGAFISAGAGAFVGIRTYAEFSLLARQSAFMLRVLRAYSAELEAAAMSVDQPLSSQQIGRTLFQTTTAMMQDITGWAQLFRIKTIEAG